MLWLNQHIYFNQIFKWFCNIAFLLGNLFFAKKTCQSSLLEVRFYQLAVRC